MRKALLGILAISLLAACSSPAKLVATSTAPAQGTIPAVVTTKTVAAAKVTYGSSINDIASRLGCDAPTPVPTDTTSISLPTKPTADVSCSFQGQKVEITTWPNSAAEGLALTLAGQLAKDFGVTAYAATGDGWVASLQNDPNGTPDPTVEKSVAQAIAAKLGGTVNTYGA